MSRLSLRARLTFAFAAAMAVVVAGLGVFVQGRVAGSLQRTLDDGLRARAAALASLADQTDNALSSPTTTFAARGLDFGQLITAGGRIYDASLRVHGRQLLTAAQRQRARRGSYFLSLENPSGQGPARAFVAPIRAQGRRLVLLVGTSLRNEQSTLGSLRTGLLVGGPIALLLASIGGYLLAGAALRPVERMRARAAGMSLDGRGARLPAPARADEIGRLGQTLNAMLERLDAARARERRFLADASHELRTPLALLKAEIELALDEPRTASELTAALRSAGEETDRLVALAEDLLVLAQADQDELALRREPVAAGQLAERVATRFRARAARAGRAIEIDVEADLILALDPRRLEQALGNLIDNALRHGAGLITLRIERDSEGVSLHVVDEGAGMPAAFAAQAFERFTRDDSSRHGHGTGLGLAIVAAIARAHGGSTGIGRGGHVYLTLPDDILVADTALPRV